MPSDVLERTTRQPSKKTGNGRHTLEVRAQELYPTPPIITEAFLRVESLPRRIWEPAAGLGHMTKVLRDHGHFVFASDKYSYGSESGFIQDFFEFKKAPAGTTCICSNPPFSMAGEFVRHGLSLVPKVAIFCRLAFLESKGRSDILENNLARVYPLIERAAMLHRWSPGPDGVYREWTGKKSNSAMAMSWMVFERHHDASKGATLRRISLSSKPSQDPQLVLRELLRDDGALIL
jgi:hypothetical protein